MCEYTYVYMQYLEYIGEVPEIEDVVKLDGGRQEGGGDLLMQAQRCVHQLLSVLLHLRREAAGGEVALKNAEIDSLQRVQLREADSKNTEVSLQTCVDCEASGSRVHRGHVLHVLDVLEYEFLAVIPVLVVQVLGEEEETTGRKRSETKRKTETRNTKYQHTK